MPNRDELIDIAEAAKLAGVSPETIRQYEQYGLLSRAGDAERFKHSDVCSLFHVLEKVKSEERVSSSPLETPFPAEEPQPQTSQPSAPVQATVHSISRDELLEINQLLRAQIQIIRDERDWLRERVEKLEERSEREQMLLLAESQTVRSLLAKEPRTKRWTIALPWFRSQPV